MTRKLPRRNVVAPVPLTMGRRGLTRLASDGVQWFSVSTVTWRGTIMKALRVYVDTSVIGGCLDDEFAVESKRLFEAAAQGRVKLLVSAIVARELSPAPAKVTAILKRLFKRYSVEQYTKLSPGLNHEVGEGFQR